MVGIEFELCEQTQSRTEPVTKWAEKKKENEIWRMCESASELGGEGKKIINLMIIRIVWIVKSELCNVCVPCTWNLL